MIKCLVCDKIFNKNIILGAHIISMHKNLFISVKDYYDKYIKKEGEGICACGEETRYVNVIKGYNKRCSNYCTEARAGSLNSNYGNKIVHSNEFKLRQSKNMIDRWDRGEIHTTNKGMRLNLTNEERMARVGRMKKINEIGFINRGGKCKFYKIDGFTIQGRYELYYYLKYLRGTDVQKAKNIKTPLGWYTADFDTGDYMLEIKSMFTIKTCVQNGQYNKIKWVCNNIKKVKIIVLKESTVEQYLKDVNTIELEFKP